MDIHIWSQIFKETTWLAYCIFFLYLFLGLRAAFKKEREYTSVEFILIYPIPLVAYNFLWLFQQIQNLSLLIFWVAALSLGALFGWWQVRNVVIKAKTLNRFVFPRLPFTLVLILLYFAVRLFFYYYHQINPFSTPLHISDCILSGLVTGAFVGRSLHFFSKCMKTK